MMKKIIFIFFFNFLISDVSEGIVLLPDFQQDVIVLININNEIINSWEVPGLIKAYLNPDSTIYTISRNNDNNFSMQLLNWEGESLWSYLLLKDICRLHHELKITPSGTLLCLCRETILAEDNLFFDGDLNIDKIIEIEPQGANEANIIWEWRFYSHLVQDQNPGNYGYGNISENPQLLNIFAYDDYNDYTHLNCIDFNASLNQIIISSRSLNEIYVIDHSTTTIEANSSSGGFYNFGGNILYRWGNPTIYERGDTSNLQLFAPHGVNWIPSNYPNQGNILVFSNAHSNMLSAVVEIEPPILNNGLYELGDYNPFGPLDYTWFFQENFFSLSHSGLFRMPNGNTFISSFQDRQIFEINLNGEREWEYEGEFSNVNRAIKYTDSYFYPLLPGDINQDNITNILDVVSIVNIVLGQNLISFYADINNDEYINVLDVVSIVNLILSDEN